MKPAPALLAAAITLAGCTGMNDTQQRAVTGTMIGVPSAVVAVSVYT